MTVAVLVGLVTAVIGLPAVAVAAPAVRPSSAPLPFLTLLNGVRLAGLWEMPAGQMAAARGNKARVREIGAKIAQEHVKLDQDVVDAANKLGVPLPSEPTPEQKGWLKEMRGAFVQSGVRPDLRQPAAGGARQDLPDHRRGPGEHPQRHHPATG